MKLCNIIHKFKWIKIVFIDILIKEHWKYFEIIKMNIEKISNWNFVYSISGCRVDFNTVEFEIHWNCTTQDNKMCIWPYVWCNEQFLFAHVFNKQLSVIPQMHFKDIEQTFTTHNEVFYESNDQMLKLRHQMWIFSSKEITTNFFFQVPFQQKIK